MGLETIAIASLVVSAASAGYSMYTQSENADKQRDAIDEQKRQEAARAAAQADRVKEDNLRLQGQQRAALGAAGVDLAGGGTAATLLNETATLGNRDQNTLRTDLNNRMSSLNAQESLIPSTGSIVAGNMLNFGASALNTYSNYQSAITKQNLLTKQQDQLKPTNFIAPKAKYSLLGDNTITY